MEFNAIGSGNWEGINFNRRFFQISMIYRTFGPIYILKSSVLLHFCQSGPTDRRFSGSLHRVLQCMLKLCLLMAAILDGGRGHRTQFESILPKDHPCHVCFKLADWLQRRRLLNTFPIGPMLKLCPLKVAILDGGQGHRTQF
jgi:hypothetical protein